MAEVWGELGGNPIELNNAATEATLKQLLAAMLAMGSKGGKSSKFQKEYEDQLKKLYEGTKKLTRATDDQTNAADKAAEARKKEIDKLNKNAQALGAMMGAAEMAATKLTSLVQSLANMQNSLTGAAQALAQIPIVGGTLGAVFGAVAGAAEKTYKSFQQAAEVGANFGGSIGDMIDAATGAGLTIDQFSGIIAKSGESLALLGGTTANGAKRLAELGRGIRDSNLGNELAALGYTTEAINSGLATYSGMLAKTGALQGMNNQQLIQSTGTYLKNLDAVSKLTGQSKKELEDARQQRMKDAQFRMIMSKMDAASQENLQMLMDTIPEEHREGMKEIIATGTATSEAGKAAMAFLPDSAKQMMDLNRQIETTGKVSATEARNLSVAYQREASAFAKTPLASNISKFGDETQKRLALGAMNVAARTGDVNKAFEQQQQEAEARARKEKELKEKGLDPASMKAYQEQIAAVSNQFTKLLASSGLLETMMTVFNGFVGFVSTVLVPVFKIMGDYAGIIGVGFGAMAALIAAVNVELALKNFMDKMEKSTIGQSILARKAELVEKLKSIGLMKLFNLPLTLAIAAIGGVVYLFRKLGGDLSVVGDGIKYYWTMWKSLFNFIKLGFAKVLNTISFGKFGGDWIKEAEEDLAANTEERAELERKMAGTMRKNREEMEKNTQAQKEQREESEKASTTGTGYNFSSSQALLESAAKRAGTSGSVGAVASGGPANMSSYLKTVAMLESGGNANAKAGTSSASGMFQFTAGTWQQMTKEMGKNYSLEDRFDPKKSAEVMEYFTSKQKGQLEKSIGREASSTDLYMSHFLGAGGAGKFINAMNQNPNAIAADLDPRAAAANKSIFYDKEGRARTVAEVYQLMGNKVARAESQVASGNVPASVAALGGGSVTPAGSTAVAAATAKPETKPATQVASAGAGAPGAGGQAASLNDVVASLQTLNMQVGQLVAYNRAVLDISQKQLSVQKSFSGDMMSGVAAA